MDYLDAKKGFRPRATIDSVLPRMSTVDRQNEVQNIRRLMRDTDLETSHLEKSSEDPIKLNEDHSKFDITEKELKCILKKIKIYTYAEFYKCGNSSNIEDKLEKHGYIYRDLKDFPTEERHTIKYATVEFAGIKFKTKASTGDEYMENINKVVINSLFNNKLFPNLQHIEEKYSFTPDDFKAATRQKRHKSMPFSISHLKIGDEIMSSERLSKSAVLNTELGKKDD
ncbi:unnamed protein product [Mytilus coruscus]|uniref:Uncharacterized protein n=1 Tax=Mytilus coruscus TaxID=42192 RepID=A0A6J8D1A8_MYTCO|nr:unnamed protein product [Mytilus coruscus]